MGLQLPALGQIKRKTDGVTAFAGYNHNLRIRDNEFYDMRNITGEYLPVIASRGRRAGLRKLTKPNGLYAHDRLCWVDGTDFYYNGNIVGQVEDSEKTMARMGAYVLIWPDRVYYNTHTGEFGSLYAKAVTAGTVSCTLCKADGTAYETYTVSADAPEKPENGALWMDTGATPNVLRQYSASSAMWTSIPTVYTMISCTGIGADFAEYDGVTVSGLTDAGLNGDFCLIGRGEDYVIVTALIQAAFTQTEAVTIERKVPELDYLTECDNRIWGCSSAKHEIYACALGDPKNWHQFMGLSTDSYAMTVGSAGDFTGACTHLGAILFFKENCIHQLMGSKPANFQLADTGCRGVAKGSERSLCVVNETLFYRSVRDVCAYGAALPSSISSALGMETYRNAVGGALGSRYFICMEAEASAGGAGAPPASEAEHNTGETGARTASPDVQSPAHVLCVYDTATGVWCREDGANVKWFAALGNELYFLDADGVLWSVGGAGMEAYGDSAFAAPEGPVEWSLETGDMGLDAACNQYVSGIQLYAECDLGATVCVELQYDGCGAWTEAFRSAPARRRSLTIPIIPRRCRTLRMRLHGVGGFRLYSIVRKTEAGSDIYGG